MTLFSWFTAKKDTQPLVVAESNYPHRFASECNYSSYLHLFCADIYQAHDKCTAKLLDSNLPSSWTFNHVIEATSVDGTLWELERRPCGMTTISSVAC